MAWLAQWLAEERAVQAVYGRTRADWRALWFAIRWHLGKPVLKVGGRWRCAMCNQPLDGGLGDHRCAADGERHDRGSGRQEP